MAENRPKSGIRIYKYKKEIQHTFETIRGKISAVPEHKQKIRMSKDDPVQRHVTYKFTEMDKTPDILWYEILSERELPENVPRITYHDVCVSRKGYLIMAGLTDRDALLRYLASLLHPQQYAFEPRYLTKQEIEKMTEGILEEDANKIYRPRFHFFQKFEGREFNDFYVSQTECATDDPEYPKLLQECQYFEPIFKTQRINGRDFVADVKLNHTGMVYSSQRMSFGDWIKFVKEYAPWCL